MKKWLSFTVALLLGGNLWAQDIIEEESPATDPTQEIWGNKQTHSGTNNISDNNQARKAKPALPSPASAPIDGGLVGLLAAGALYGKRKIDARKNNAIGKLSS